MSRKDVEINKRLRHVKRHKPKRLRAIDNHYRSIFLSRCSNLFYRQYAARDIAHMCHKYKCRSMDAELILKSIYINVAVIFKRHHNNMIFNSTRFTVSHLVIISKHPLVIECPHHCIVLVRRNIYVIFFFYFQAAYYLIQCKCSRGRQYDLCYI